ncbi:MAG: aminoacyl-tRNA hydrolase [Planctomycetes bacterium]|nr:aminoacyl-tRNA hydrolase [Planctomycetota bacterium]
MPVEVRPGLVIPDDELSLTFSRSGGPGGQHVNKASTKVLLRWDLRGSRVVTDDQRARLLAKLPPRYVTAEGEVLLHCDEHKSQHENRAACLARLGSLARDALRREKRRIPTKPGKGARARRREGKERQSQKKRERRGAHDG